MTPQELMTPPTEVEISSVMNLLKDAGSECVVHVNTIRRLVFQRDRLIQYEHKYEHNERLRQEAAAVADGSILKPGM